MNLTPHRACAVVLALLLLAPLAYAVTVFDTIEDEAALLQSRIEARLAEIGEPATKAEGTEAKGLAGAAAVLAVVRPQLLALTQPAGLFDMGPIKTLAKAGAYIERSGTADTDVLLAFQNLYESVDEWGDALDALYDAAAPSLSDKEEAKVESMAQKSFDLQNLAILQFVNGELGKATKTGAKALATFAKATAMAQKYAAD